MDEVKEFQEMMVEYQGELSVMEEEHNSQVLGKYGRLILDHLKEMDNARYTEIMNDKSLLSRVLERQKQVKDLYRTIVDQQGDLEKVGETKDFMEQVQARTRICFEADSIVMREIVLKIL